MFTKFVIYLSKHCISYSFTTNILNQRALFHKYYMQKVLSSKKLLGILGPFTKIIMLESNPYYVISSLLHFVVSNTSNWLFAQLKLGHILAEIIQHVTKHMQKENHCKALCSQQSLVAAWEYFLLDTKKAMRAMTKTAATTQPMMMPMYVQLIFC